MLGEVPHNFLEASCDVNLVQDLAYCCLALLNNTAIVSSDVMTDFDTGDDAVGICKVVMKSVAPRIQVIDTTHQSTPYDIEEGARFSCYLRRRD